MSDPSYRKLLAAYRRRLTDVEKKRDELQSWVEANKQEIADTQSMISELEDLEQQRLEHQEERRKAKDAK